MVRRLLLLAALFLPACLDQDAIDFAFCDPGETCFEATNVCPDVEPGPCPDSLLAYDPGVKELGALAPTVNQVGDILAARVDPFAAATDCASVVVVLNIDGGCSKVGSSLDVAVFDETTEEPTRTPVFQTVSLADGEMVEIGQGFVRLTLPLSSEHACGARPFVAVRLGNTGTCIAANPATCDDGNSFRKKAGGEWGTVASEPLQIYVGLADCG